VHAVPHRRCDIDDPQDRSEWEAAGRPLIPAVRIDGVTKSVLYPGQLSPLLGVPEPDAVVATRMAWDLVALTDAWADAIQNVDPALLHRDLPLSRPNPQRPMAIRDLLVNVLHPIALLPDAWQTRRLEWFPEERDEEIAATLPDQATAAAYARGVCAALTSFVAEQSEPGFDGNPVIWSPRGEVTYDRLLAAQRWHAAFHYAQMVEVLGDWKARLDKPYPLHTMAGLDLPSSLH
jgi:hypothetical protein